MPAARLNRPSHMMIYLFTLEVPIVDNTLNQLIMTEFREEYHNTSHEHQFES